MKISACVMWTPSYGVGPFKDQQEMGYTEGRSKIIGLPTSQWSIELWLVVKLIKFACRTYNFPFLNSDVSNGIRITCETEGGSITQPYNNRRYVECLDSLPMITEVLIRIPKTSIMYDVQTSLISCYRDLLCLEVIRSARLNLIKKWFYSSENSYIWTKATHNSKGRGVVMM